MAGKSIAEDLEQFLADYWEKTKSNTEDPWLYTKALATKFIDYVKFSEKMMRVMATKIRKLEVDLAAATGQDTQDQQGQPPQADTPAVGPTPPPQGPPPNGPRGDLVRVDALGQPLTPEEQASEEQADLQFEGHIDMTRYRPRASFANRAPAGGQPPPSNGSPPPAPTAQG